VAIKLARWATGRQNIIHFTGSFHGRTLGSLSFHAAGGMAKVGVGPLATGAVPAPYPNPYRNPFKQTGKDLVDTCIEYVEYLLQTVSPPEITAGILVEPLQSVAGFVWPGESFLPRLRELCDRHRLLLITDEVFSGILFTGALFAARHVGVEADIITIAKSCAGGVPMGLVIAKDSVMTWTTGMHSNTFAGNHLACAASITMLDYIEGEGLAAKAERQGRRIAERLADLADRYPLIGNISGKGLMVGIELVLDQETKQPAAAAQKAVIQAALRDGVILLPGGKSTIRFCPPAVITDEQMDYVLDVIDRHIAAAITAK
jgi:4-aminobutyrate aminotransferase